MEAVKIKLYQNLVNYRMEMSFGYVQTYPLPTPSMIRGMVHALLDLKEYHHLKISIQGCYESVVTNMQRVYKFDRDRKSRPGNPYDVTVGGSKKTATHGVMFVDEIVNMELLLHICFDEPELNTRLLEAVRRETVVLGRNEDIARVDFEVTKMVRLEQVDDDEEFSIRNNIFIPRKLAEELQVSGPVFHLPFYYKPVTSFEDKRIFEFVDAAYIARDSSISEHEYISDEDGDTVFFLDIMQEKEQEQLF